ncbi:MAG: glycerol-3-phosphate dehydrogenase/oxidase [Deltaproteobacteria bacterium]|nr:glycerol-3-phosphate dehydrogenase/oxidase [Deltaproteobacteria bacterium]
MERFIENYSGEKFDIIVIGGGITGATVAYDAASRGLSVALVEKKDFGWATSSATSKLIHGGLRYLANMEFDIVRESLRERRTITNIAPNLVYPAPVMITCYNTNKNNSFWKLKIGMVLYDLLSFDKSFTWDKSKKIPSHKTISAKKAVELEPVVKKEGLKGAHIYYDCASQYPERLTLAFIKSAVRKGGSVSNYAKAEEFIFLDQNEIIGVKIKNLLNGEYVELKGELTINCGGPWADEILELTSDKVRKKSIVRSEGIHIITRKLTRDHMVTYSKSSRTGFFMLPWRGHTLIGLTDKQYKGDPDAYKVTKESILELLADVNEYLGEGNKLKYEDILYTYGGLRPLVGDESQDTRKMSRKYEIFDNADEGIEGMITVEGGKYTTSRNLAEHVLKVVGKKLKKNLGKCITHRQHLVSCEIRDLPEFLEEIKKKNPEIDGKTIDWLGRLYGTEYKSVIEMAGNDKTLLEPVNPDGEILAQILYAIKKEQAKTLQDIVLRRTGIGTLGNPDKELIKKVADIAAKYLGWDEEKKAEEISGTLQSFKLPD